jgi:hypothetical protein
MKQLIGKFVEDFCFTDDQRTALLAAWQRRKGREKAKAFITAVEGRVGEWFSMDADHQTTIPEMRDHANRISKAVVELQTALDAPPEDFVIQFEGYVTAKLYVERFRRQYSDAVHDLACIYGMPRAAEMIETLDGLLVVLHAAVGEMTTLEGTPGKDKRSEQWLVQMLAGEYEQHFGKLPSASNGSVFRKFVAELSVQIKVEMGADCVRQALETVSIRDEKSANPTGK